MHLDIDTNMKLIGKRFPFLATYQVCIATHTYLIAGTFDGKLNSVIFLAVKVETAKLKPANNIIALMIYLM